MDKFSTKFNNTQGTILGNIPDDSELARRWINQNPQTYYYKKEFLRPVSGVYKAINKDVILQEILRVLQAAADEGYRASARRLYSVMELARIEIAVTSENFIAVGGK